MVFWPWVRKFCAVGSVSKAVVVVDTRLQEWVSGQSRHISVYGRRQQGGGGEAMCAKNHAIKTCPSIGACLHVTLSTRRVPILSLNSSNGSILEVGGLHGGIQFPKR